MAVDYNALAQKYGGAPAAAPPNVASVAAQYGGSPVQSNQSSTPAISGGPDILGAGGKFLNDSLLTPAASVAATPVQLLAKALGRPDPYANGIPGPAGNMPVAPATPAGFLQKGGQAASLATLAVAPETTGIKALTALGAASGAANSLAAGNTDAGQVLKDTIFGGMFGFGLGTVGKFGGFIADAEKGKTGVTGYVQNEIAKTDPSLLSKYIDAAHAHSSDIRVPTPDALAEKEMEKRAGILVNQVIPDAGKAVGEARKAAGNLPITYATEATQGIAPTGEQAVGHLADDINTRMQEMTGHQFSSYGGSAETDLKINYPGGASTEGIEPVEGAITKLPGRSVELSSAEQKALESLDQQLKILSKNPTVQTASDVIKNLDSKIDWDRPQFGEGSSPVDAVIRYARGAINRTIGPASPELAKANAAFSQLKDLQGQIGTQAGKDLQSASLFMRRVLSGDKSGDVIPVLDQLDKTVAPYLKGDTTNLVQHSILANWAKYTFGDSSTKTLFNRYLNESATNASSVFGYPRQFMNTAFKDILGAAGPNPEDYAMSVAKGEPYSMNPITRQVDKFLDSAKGKPLIGTFVEGLKGLGVSAHNLESAAMQLGKTYLLLKLTQPHPGPLQGAVPNVTLPPGVEQQPVQGPTSIAAPPRTLSVAQPTKEALSNVTAPASGQQFSSQARQLSDFGMNMKNRGLSLS